MKRRAKGYVAFVMYILCCIVLEIEGPYAHLVVAIFSHLFKAPSSPLSPIIPTLYLSHILPLTLTLLLSLQIQGKC
ncbi:hypothetical protein ACS0TY_028856 [Phlomoides rotata]